MPGPWGEVDGSIFGTNIFSQKTTFSFGNHLSKCKYNVCSIKLETKRMRLHTIQVTKISLFLVIEYAVARIIHMIDNCKCGLKSNPYILCT